MLDQANERLKRSSAVESMVTAPPLPELAASSRVDPRNLNVQGRVIHMHRALRRLDFSTSRLLAIVIGPAVLSALVYVSWPLIALLWTAIIRGWISLLGPQISLAQFDVVMLKPLHIPYPLVAALAPSVLQWWLGLTATLAVMTGSLYLPSRMLPLAYLLRFVGCMQLAAQVYFYFWGASYPHTAGGSMASTMQSSFGLMLFVPWLYGLIYNVFDFSLSKKLLLPLLALAYLAIMTPIQITLEAVLLYQFSLLWHPLLYLLGTTLLQFWILLALYAWAMSWKSVEQAH